MSLVITFDPYGEKYYDLSPYSFCANNPINFVDPDGRNIFIYDIENQQFKKYEWKSVGDIWGFYDENDQIYSGSNDFINAASNALKDLMGTNTGKNIVAQLTGYLMTYLLLEECSQLMIQLKNG